MVIRNWGNSGGSWLPEEKKANMWYGRGNSGGSWLPEEKKLICGTEGEIVVAHGRLPSPALQWTGYIYKYITQELNSSILSNKV